MKLNRTARRALICMAVIVGYALMAWGITLVRSDCQDFSSKVGTVGKFGQVVASNCPK